MLQRYRGSESEHVVDLERSLSAGGECGVKVDGASHRVELVRIEGDEVVFRLDGELVRARVAIEGERRLVHCAGQFATSLVRDDGKKKKRRASGEEGGLVATMHSQVVAVSAIVGAAVKRGDVLVTLEAMKMEMRIAAPFDGVVRAVSCAAGEVVERGRVLVEIAPLAS